MYERDRHAAFAHAMYARVQRRASQAFSQLLPASINLREASGFH
jgi:hypothetical protein